MVQRAMLRARWNLRFKCEPRGGRRGRGWVLGCLSDAEKVHVKV